MSHADYDLLDAMAWSLASMERRAGIAPLFVGFDHASGPDLTVMHRVRSAHRAVRRARAQRKPRLHPTKGYRGAHKLFRGGSR